MQRSTTTAASVSFKLEPLNTNRANSAQANLQSHPCFQSSLFNDKDRAAGSLKVWKERYLLDRAITHLGSSDSHKKTLNKDYQLENIIWSQSVTGFI